VWIIENPLAHRARQSSGDSVETIVALSKNLTMGKLGFAENPDRILHGPGPTNILQQRKSWMWVNPMFGGYSLQELQC
jgi:hypothetical protein